MKATIATLRPTAVAGKSHSFSFYNSTEFSLEQRSYNSREVRESIEGMWINWDDYLKKKQQLKKSLTKSIMLFNKRRSPSKVYMLSFISVQNFTKYNFFYHLTLFHLQKLGSEIAKKLMLCLPVLGVGVPQRTQNWEQITYVENPGVEKS